MLAQQVLIQAAAAAAVQDQPAMEVLAVPEAEPLAEQQAQQMAATLARVEQVATTVRMAARRRQQAVVVVVVAASAMLEQTGPLGEWMFRGNTISFERTLV